MDEPSLGLELLQMAKHVEAVVKVAYAEADTAIQPLMRTLDAAAFLAQSGHSKQLVTQAMRVNVAYVILMAACEEQALMLRRISKPVVDEVDPKKH